MNTIILLSIVVLAILLTLAYYCGYCFREKAITQFGTKLTVFARGRDGLTIANPDYPFTPPFAHKIPWDEVVKQFPSHEAEALAKIEEARARKEANSL